MKKLILPAAIALLTATAAYSADLNGLINNAGLRADPSAQKIIDFRLDNLSGNTVSLNSLKGHVILLNFWATWCGPCRSEMGSLEALYKRYANQGFVVVAVNLQESPSRVKSFAEKFGLTFPILLDHTGRIALTYSARALPTTYLIDKQGTIAAGIIGAHEWNTPQMYRLVRALLDAS